MSDVKQRYRCAEAAAIVGVSERTIQNWIRSGKLPAIRVVHATYIEREELEKFIAAKPHVVPRRG